MKNKKRLIIIGIGAIILTNILSLTISGLATWYLTKKDTETKQEQSSNKEENTKTDEPSDKEQDVNSDTSISREYNFEGLSFQINPSWSIYWHSEPGHSDYYMGEEGTTPYFKPYILFSPNLVEESSDHKFSQLAVYFSKGNDVEDMVKYQSEVISFQDETFGKINNYFDTSSLDPGERYIFFR